MQKEFFFQGKSVIRKIKDKAFFDFVVAHQRSGKAIRYIPMGIYSNTPGVNYVNIVHVEGGSIPMTFHFPAGEGGYISEMDWMLLFRRKEVSDREELLRRLEVYDEIVNSCKPKLPWSVVEEIKCAQNALKNFINEMGK